jgi:hypothetical protein
MCHRDVPSISSNENRAQERPEKDSGGARSASHQKRHDSYESGQEHRRDSVWNHCHLRTHERIHPEECDEQKTKAAGPEKRVIGPGQAPDAS